jgi:hypothetical protein
VLSLSETLRRGMLVCVRRFGSHVPVLCAVPEAPVCFMASLFGHFDSSNVAFIDKNVHYRIIIQPTQRSITVIFASVYYPTLCIIAVGTLVAIILWLSNRLHQEIKSSVGRKRPRDERREKEAPSKHQLVISEEEG